MDSELKLAIESFDRYEKLELMKQPGKSLAAKLFNMYSAKGQLPEKLKDLSLSEQLEILGLTEADLREEREGE